MIPMDASGLRRLARSEAALAVLLLGFGLLVYRNTLTDAFISDDYLWIAPMSFGRLLGYFASSWGHGGYFRPIMRVLFFAETVLFGDHPVGWRVVNMVIHVLNAWLIARIVVHFTGNRLATSAAAMLFVAYPAAVENVAWISGATHSLCALLMLASLCALYRSLGEGDGALRLRHAMISGAAALAAIWTYDVAVVLPVMQAIVVLLHRTEHRGTPQRLVGWAIAFGAWAVGDLWRELVLPRHFDAQLPSVLDALSKHFAAYWDLLLVTVQLRTLAALVAGMALMLITSRAAPGTPRLVRRLAAATSLAAVSYAPFVMFAGDSYRFYYSSLMYWILALALVLDYAGWAARGARLAFGAGCAALLVVSVYETGKFCQEWRVVSDTTRLMLEQVHAAVPEWPDRTDLVFIAVPDHYRRALAYLGYFEPMIAHTFGEVRGRVLMTETLDAASAVAEGRRRIVFEWVGFATGRGTAAGVRAVAASGL